MKTLFFSPSLADLHARLRIVIGAAVLPVGIFAQAAATSEKTAAATEDKVIELTPFEVRSDLDTGYLGMDTASGSRLNTKLRDTPASISVFTAEFLNDMAATTIA